MVVEYLRNYNGLTYTEEAIRDYFLEHPQDLIDFNINELSNRCNVGMASINRLCKKLGFKGFADFKIAYLKEYKDYEKNTKAKNIRPFDATTKTKDIINDLPYVYEKAIGYTQMALNENVLNRVVGQIQNSMVIIVATGLNRSIAEIFAYKIEELGIVTKVVDSIHHQFIDSLRLKNIKIFGILISLRGQNEVVVAAAKIMHKYRIANLLISSQLTNDISQHCSEVLKVIPIYSAKEFANTQFVMSVQYILDVIYSMLFVKNLRLVENLLDSEKYKSYYKGVFDENKIK